MSSPFPPHRWGDRSPTENGYYWFVGSVGGQWKRKFKEPTIVKVVLDEKFNHKSVAWHDHAYGMQKCSWLHDLEGRWWGPVRCPAGWER